MIKKSLLSAVVLLMSLGLGLTGHAQGINPNWNQGTACPGWNNPSGFTAGGAYVNKYSGQAIRITSSDKPCPNPLTANTGVSSMGTNYTASQMGNVSTGNCSNSIPNSNKQYVIMTNTNGFDPNTGNHLRYIPTQFNTYDNTPGAINTSLTKSIRIGDGCPNGASNNTWNGQTVPYDYSGAALYYTMEVTPDNAMMYLYYAIVAEAPTHYQIGNPTFIIRVMKKNAAGVWTQFNDTLAYYISTATGPSSYASENCPPMGYVTMAGAGETGWHQHPEGDSWNPVYYKDWDKVCLNLIDYMYDTLQIQVLIYDCIYNAHYAYGYIAGECRPMLITVSGCPPGLSTDVATLSAPKDLKNYVWYKSDFGRLQVADYSNPNYTWTQITPDIGPNNSVYHAQSSDFNVTRRIVNGRTQSVDSVGNWQTFRCKLTSAIDPDKPFDSYLYVSVQNTKPSMSIDSLVMCDGTVKLWNRSQVPGDPSLVVPSRTLWKFYNNEYCVGDSLYEITGDSAVTHFDDLSVKGVLVRTFTTTEGCYSDGLYSLYPRQNPRAGMTISNRVLCDTVPTVLTDTTSGLNNSRIWAFRPMNAENNDMTLSDVRYGVGDELRSIERSFSHGVEPIELTVRNGLYYLNPLNTADTIWCQTMVRDTVSVFLHPELEVEGATVVCEGSKTDATVKTLGVEGCSYQWSTAKDTIMGNLPPGATLRVVPYADTATYYVKVTSPQGCVAWDSLQCYMVKPKLSIEPGDGRICPNSTATLTGSAADHYTWSASPADPSLEGQDSADAIVVSPSVTTTYTMVGHGSNNCDALPLTKTVTIVPVPTPRVNVSPSSIDSDNPTVVLRDLSTNGVRSSWLFDDGTVLQGREVSHRFENCTAVDSMPVTLTSYNDLDCPTVYPFKIPVIAYTAWFPTVFTPGRNDGNDYFSLYANQEYEYFHIFIFNRRGEQVYESDDVHFRWDGTKDGEPLPQGAYVYTCRYRKPGTTTLMSLSGTITLVR